MTVRLGGVGPARQRGFTLVELLVVVAIIGVLIAIALPVYLGFTRGARDRSAEADLRDAVVELAGCNADHKSFPIALPARDAGGYLFTAATGCAGQSLALSAGTVLVYTPSGTAFPVVSYVAVTTSPDGNGRWWCFDSATAGAITGSSTPVTTC